MTSTTEDARRSFFWSFLEKWLALFTQLAVFVLLGRLLAPEDFGLVALATAYLMLTDVFVDSGFGRALVQKKELSPSDISTALTVAAGLGVCLCVSTAVFAPSIAQAFQEPELAPLLSVMSVSILLESSSVIPAALLERHMRFKALAIRRTASTAVGGVVAVLMAFGGFGVWSLVAQTLVTGLVSAVLVWVAYRSWPGLGLSRSSFAALRRTGFSVMGIELLGFANAQADKLLIGAYLGAEALGYYFMAMRVVSITVELFTSVFSRVSLSIFSKLQSDVDVVRRWLEKLTTGTTLLTVPVFCFYGLFSTELLLFVFGPQWGESAEILQVLVFLGIINSMLIFDRHVLIALGRSGTALLLTAGQVVLGLLLLLVAVSHGILVVALAVVLRQYLFWPVRLVALRRVVHIDVLSYIRGWCICFALAVLVTGLGQVIDSRDLPVAFSMALRFLSFITVFGTAYVAIFRGVLADMVRLALSRPSSP